jgi:hypothetical protein
MALRICDSFDHHVTADMTQKWNSRNSGINIAGDQGRRGTSALNVEWNNSYVTKTLDAQASWIVGFVFKRDAMPITSYPSFGNTFVVVLRPGIQ